MNGRLGNNKQAIRIVVADDHHVVRSGIRAELQRQPDMEVVGEASNGEDALAMTQRLQPDVLVLDINMPGLTGISITERLGEMEQPKRAALSAETGPRSTWPPHILILSAYCEPEYVYSLFAAGAKGYLLKDEPAHRIVSSVRQVIGGEPALSLPVQKVLLTRSREQSHDLSARELEVLKLIARGHTNEEIASILFIAIGTVKNHVANIYRKLPNVRTRSEAVAWAWENRIVRAD